MARVENIRLLFASIRLESIRAYLLEKGWRVDETSFRDRLQFEGLVSEDGEPYQLWVWDSEDHPKFRDRLPNVVFKLAVIEGREPLDIANDIAQSSVQDETAPPSERKAERLTPQRFRFCNSNSSSVMRLEVVGRASAHQIAPGESVEVVIQSVGEVCEIDYDCNAVRLSVARGASIRLYHGLPTRYRSRPLPTIQKIAHDCLAAHRQLGQDEERLIKLLEAIQPLLKRADFELTPQADGAFAPEIALRQTAVVITGIVRKLPDDPTSAECLVRLASHVLGRAGMFFEIGNDVARSLFESARVDDEVAPTLTLSFLRDNTARLSP